MTLFTLYVATRCALRRMRKSLRNEHAVRRMRNECRTLRALIYHVIHQTADLKQKLDECQDSVQDQIADALDALAVDGTAIDECVEDLMRRMDDYDNATTPTS